jgi:Phage integrase family
MVGCLAKRDGCESRKARSRVLHQCRARAQAKAVKGFSPNQCPAGPATAGLVPGGVWPNVPNGNLPKSQPLSGGGSGGAGSLYGSTGSFPGPRAFKKGSPATHPIRGDELRALRKLQREQEPKSSFVFTSERGAPFTTAGFAKIVERLGKAASIDFKTHPHMLRHAWGYALANQGHDTRALQAYLGHKNIQHTTKYTELAPTRFKDFWS